MADDDLPDGNDRGDRAPGDSAGGQVSDAEWHRLIGELTGPAEARGTNDSFAVPIDPDVQARAQAELGGPTAGQHAAGQGLAPGADEAGLPDAGGPATELSETGLLGSTIVRSARGTWRRWRLAIDRWLRRPPATLTLPAGSKTRFTIGREADCDMTLLDRTVSRLHASLKREGDGWLLTDLGSKNGTRLNGWRVTAPITVSAGDWVSFGAATFVLTERPGRSE